MGFAPDKTELLARARGDLRMGVPVVLAADDGAALVMAAETLTPDRLAAAKALGTPVLAVTGRRAATLKARAYDGDVARVVLPSDADPRWVAAVADPAGDLAAPMKGPLLTEREGPAHLHRAGISLTKAARLLPAALVVPIEDGEALARAEGLTLLQAGDVVPLGVSPLHRLVSARVPLELAERSRLHIFRPDDGAEEHYAIEIGDADRSKSVLCRLHSACFTGDLLGSLKCDCGPQLRAALAQMGAEGEGVLLYLNQEGRGIGLANKMRAYSLQDQGFDTVEANHRLGFEDDERDFRIGAEILRRMGFGSVRLMTNNPAKVERLRGEGIEVTERVPLKVGESRFNHHYLQTKAAKSGHLL
ncbi:GTP cyclohydrolase II [Histidinibacterium aquaticum]|uniref:GTP cyclohydrolase-2 n=1 Tax=Histidinibacterium aquaticum TaxID=2613962 RepID=A0A5J5GET8_9RHOB|nr:GTP cyclohydrolase II [Histidinibacterium aquaticum]KAA9005994.1 GTP cyclohydrolase II [Histidinibacterium aquaticum]